MALTVDGEKRQLSPAVAVAGQTEAAPPPAITLSPPPAPRVLYRGGLSFYNIDINTALCLLPSIAVLIEVLTLASQLLSNSPTLDVRKESCC